MLDLQHLRTLREFTVRGTVTAVADVLGYSPSAVSQQLAALEREAGVPLLRRSGRRLLLTPAGQELAGSAGEILGLVEHAQARLRSGDEAPGGTVRLAVFQSAALALLPTALPRLARSAPRVRVEVTQSEPAQALEDTWARDFDLVVAEEYPHHSAPHYPGLTRVTLVQDEIALAAPIGWGASLEHHHERAWVMEPRGTASRHFAEQVCRIAGFEPDVRYETADLQAQLALVGAGLAVALIPGLMWPSAPPGVARIPVGGTMTRSVFAAFRDTSQADAGIRATLAALTDAAREVAAR
ncbi:LysR family transcriptional regulator [Demequina activiva]|uniref:Transcriptional regulator n=1 Tax=Demequina activiva TaxID=1582364 RepID=A0A919Q4W7_9MICO|nr:LysR family transcriptional regulator [Demequina activiva]GIG54563.1 transcriptional regulator [Demequina activiva]